MEKLTIELNNKTYRLSYKGLDDDIDIEDFLVVHHHNLVGDALTFPVLFNKIGLLKAEAEDEERKSKMDFDIFCADHRYIKRSELLSKTGKRPTKDEVEDAILTSPQYKVMRGKYLRAQKNTQSIEALYWSAKDKSSKLEILSKKIIPEGYENEIIEDTINGIEIKKSKNSITDKRNG